MGWLIALAVLCALVCMPIGIRAIYRYADSGVWLLIGPVKIRLYPRKQKGKVSKENDKKPSAGKHPLKGGSVADFLPIFKSILAFLDEFRSKIRVKCLELKIVLAGDDPGDVGIHYGRTWAALGNLIPHLENLLIIKKKDIGVACDFTAEKTLIYARVDVTITVARALCLMIRHGKQFINDILNLKNLRKGGAGL